jgi:hypothetical protein
MLVRLCLSLLALPTSVLAQGVGTVEYGDASELKGVTRIFIYTADDLVSRNNIAGIIRKNLPDISVSDQAGEAQVILLFAWKSEVQLSAVVSGSQAQGTASAATGTATAVPLYARAEAGSGRVVRFVSGERVRYLLAFDGGRGGPLGWIDKRPSSQFAIAFVKAYRAANGIEEPKPKEEPRPF